MGYPGCWWHHGWTPALEAPVSPPGRHMGHAFIEVRKWRKRILLMKNHNLMFSPIWIGGSRLYFESENRRNKLHFSRTPPSSTCYETKVIAAQVTASGYSSTSKTPGSGAVKGFWLLSIPIEVGMSLLNSYSHWVCDTTSVTHSYCLHQSLPQ